jgi:LacI family transcriptional regulator
MGSGLTLEKIARLSGVSRSTVSRVINNHPNVSDQVRQRVRQVIAETGYRPNMAARSLVTQRTGIIGLVIPRAFQSLFTDPFYPRLIQGITQACNNNDYMLSLFMFHTKEEEQKLYPTVVRARLLDGVIVSASEIDDPFIPQLIQNQMPFVIHGRPDEAAKVSFVQPDNVAGAYTAVSHLVRLGYKRIATITGPLNTTVGLDRQQGYRDAINERNGFIDEALIVEGDFSELGGYVAMRRLIPQRPDAVFAASDAMALGALRALREAGLSVPSDVAVVGFDDLPPAALADPPLTTLRQFIRRQGIQLVETLIDIITSDSELPRHITIGTELVIRSSCGSV